MRLREAMVLALRYDAYDACLTKSDGSVRLRIVDMCFTPAVFRTKHDGVSEVKLTARDCLSEDWQVEVEKVEIEKNGKSQKESSR